MSGSRRFPYIMFGICDVCGGKGGDDPDPGNANAPARDTTGNGLVLEWFDGLRMCNICIHKRKADEESLLMAERHAEEDRFRGQAGFVNSIS